MSVYKAVSNYYIEILDFLEVKIKQYNSLETYFASMNVDMKKEIIIKICDTLLRINMLFTSRERYWLSKRKEQTAIFAIFITISIIIGILFYAILYFRIKKEHTFKLKDGSMYTIRVFKTFITYTVIYMVILNVFVAMITNAKKMKDLYYQEAAKARREGEFYINLMFEDAISNIHTPLFDLAIVSRGKMYNTKLIKGEELDPIGCPPPDKTKGETPGVSQYYDCATRTVDYEKAYGSIKSDFEKSLLTFYNNGKGYQKVKYIYILSGPIPMLKETKNILQGYYTISLKDRQGKTQEPLTLDQIKVILKTSIIEPISQVIKPDNLKYHDPNALEISQTNTNFVTNYTNLTKLFKYTAAYMYQIYSKTHEASESFESLLKPHLPSKITENDTFSQSVKEYFRKYSTNTLAQKLDDINGTSTEEALTDFVKFFSISYSLILPDVANADGYFLFEKTSVFKDLMLGINTLPMINDTYKTYIKESMYNSIVLPLKAQLDTSLNNLDTVVKQIIIGLGDFEINIMTHTEFLLGSITNDMTVSELESKSGAIADAIKQINNAILLKKQLKNKKSESPEHRFLEQPDFDEILDNMRYEEFKDLLNVKHLNKIVNDFYIKIGDSISRNESTLDNIYFNVDKKFKIWYTSVVLTIVTIVLIWSNYTMSNIQLYSYLYTDLLKREDVLKEVISQLRVKIPTLDGLIRENTEAGLKAQQYELELVYREKRNRTMNWLIRIVLPLFVMVFVICMLIAVYKKAKATHEFNTDLIESNTNSLKNVSGELSDKIAALNIIVPSSEVHKKIKNIVSFTSEYKKEIYKNMKSTMDTFEKCNYILEAQKSKLPFPYSEIAMSGFMMFITLLCILYVYAQMKPIARLKQIKELNKMNHDAMISDQAAIKMMKKEMEYLMNCHDDDISAVVFTLKVVFFIFIITFLIFYSTKVVNSASDYHIGLYNSGYYETGNCVSST